MNCKLACLTRMLDCVISLKSACCLCASSALLSSWLRGRFPKLRLALARSLALLSSWLANVQKATRKEHVSVFKWHFTLNSPCWLNSTFAIAPISNTFLNTLITVSLSHQRSQLVGVLWCDWNNLHDPWPCVSTCTDYSFLFLWNVITRVCKQLLIKIHFYFSSLISIMIKIPGEFRFFPFSLFYECTIVFLKTFQVEPCSLLKLFTFRTTVTL